MNKPFQKATTFLHGADYNPEQWLQHPEVLIEDLRLMPLAGMNAMSVGIFSWAALEPEEGRFEFGWLDKIFDDLHGIGVRIILATPSGAKPAWLVRKYPEVQRVRSDRQRQHFGGRHNHCLTSATWRSLVRDMNGRLAQRYGHHPALLLWHISNEMEGACYCPLCEQAFRDWLKNRYVTLDALNDAWWTSFWSARFMDWDDIAAPGPLEQWGVTGLFLDWNRFVTAQTIDYYRAEIEPLRRITPDIPATTNFHPSGSNDLDCWRFGREVDVVTWDNYPFWGHDPTGDYPTAMKAAFDFDLMRSLQHKPFIMLESTPGAANWHPYTIQKPGHLGVLSALQSIAHGSQSVMVFQWRKGRGAFEKFHGAVVDHVGHENTRVFRETQAVAGALEKLHCLHDSEVPAQVALYYDWESLWALAASSGPCNARFRGNIDGVKAETMVFHKALVENRVNVEMVGPEDALDCYKLVILPATYLLSSNCAAKWEAYVAQGGSLIATYLTGQVGESDLCHPGGFPGPLRGLFGVWAEETHTLPDHEECIVGIGDKKATAHHFVELLHAEDAEVRARFESGIYRGTAAITRRAYGKGQAIYLGAKLKEDHLRSWLASWVEGLGVERTFPTELPQGVYASRRGGAHFVMNFHHDTRDISVPGPMRDLLTGKTVEGVVSLAAYGIMVLI